MVSRAMIDAMSKKIPGRKKVRIHSALAGDTFMTPANAIAEVRPVQDTEQRSENASGNAITREFVFFQSELGDLRLKKSDVIEYLAESSYHSIESLSIELLGARIRAKCSDTVDPALEMDE